MQIKSLLLTTLLAGAVTAIPTARRSQVCTPQDNNGFIVRINSTDELHDKVVYIKDSVAGVDLIEPQSVIWPFSDQKRINMPGPGYKWLIPGYLQDTASAFGKQLKFDREENIPAGAEIDVFSTSCDYWGNFYLAVEYNWSWKACPIAEGQGWSIHRDATDAQCRDVKLKMTYGPPTDV